MLRVVQMLACLLACKTVLAVLLNSRDYSPANFQLNFLLGREAYFGGAYQPICVSGQ